MALKKLLLHVEREWEVYKYNPKRIGTQGEGGDGWLAQVACFDGHEVHGSILVKSTYQICF